MSQMCYCALEIHTIIVNGYPPDMERIIPKNEAEVKKQIAPDKPPLQAKINVFLGPSEYAALTQSASLLFEYIPEINETQRLAYESQ